MDQEYSLKELTKTILEHVVEFKDQLHVEEKFGENTVSISITAAKDDIGKIIGKSGNNIKALRTLLKAIGSVNDRRTIVNVID